MIPRFHLCAFLVLAAGCEVGVEPSQSAGEVGGSVREVYESAGATWDVPVPLLMALAQTQTGGQMVVGATEIDGWPAAYGVMGLRGDNLVEGARLAGLDVALVQTDREANVAAAAALLSDWADTAQVDRTDLGAWAPVIARYAGIPDDVATSHYVWDGVYGALRTGFPLEGGAVGSVDVTPDWPLLQAPLSVVGAEHPYVVWRPSPNYSTRNSRAGGVGMVVIHDCEGDYAGCWGWLASSASGVSAHYVVSENGNEITQLVHELDRAWHVGATYDCTLNGNTECTRNGYGVNDIAVGIEHAGFASQTSWNSHLLDVSAQLTCDITRTHSIPRDSYHIVAHGRLQPYNRTDPGAGWPWTDYIDRVHTACGEPTSGSTPGQFIIDSNNAANVVAKYRADASTNWTSSVNVSGYWNTGYWVAPTQAVSDPARFSFLAAAPVCYQVDAWWTAASDRSHAAPWIAYDSSGTEVGRTTVNQSVSGAQWNALGKWGFYTGWNEVDLSRWAAAGAQVVADAVRLTPATGCVICGDGVKAASEACDDGGRASGDGCSATCKAELVIASFSPATPGQPSTIVATGATPNKKVNFYVGTRAGTGAVPGCGASLLPFSAPTLIGNATADAAGRVAIRVFAPSAVAAHSYKFVAADLDTCTASPVWRQRF